MSRIRSRHDITAVLFDRDGTLIHDVPYNGDPSKVMAVDDAADALAMLRAAGMRIAVITNQSGVGRGLISRADVDAVNARIDALLGPFDGFFVCEHAPEAGCACRKPKAGLVLQACATLRCAPEEAVVVGDIGADVDAARAAGAQSILVPNDVTRRSEIESADAVAPSLRDAAAKILRWRGGAA